MFVSGDETLMALLALSRVVPFVFGGDHRLKYRKIGWCCLVSSGVLEVCEGFVMVSVGLSLDEISIPFD